MKAATNWLRKRLLRYGGESSASDSGQQGQRADNGETTITTPITTITTTITTITTTIATTITTITTTITTTIWAL